MEVLFPVPSVFLGLVQVSSKLSSGVGETGRSLVLQIPTIAPRVSVCR